MSLLHLGRFLLTALAMMGSPGPATISLMTSGAAHGPRRSLGYLAGIVAGTWLVLIGVATGITVTLLAMPELRLLLIAASAGYILWLAYRLATAPPVSAQPARAPSLGGGLLLAIANPKAWVAIAATFASARLLVGTAQDAVVKVGVLAGMLVPIMTAWLFAGSTLAPLLRSPRAGRAIHVVLAGALVAAAALALLPGG
ncbi:MAG TPA: LysE family transporter [Bacillota bacterium]|nr:LysE family transporter [Bacillota bacterium]